MRKLDIMIGNGVTRKFGCSIIRSSPMAEQTYIVCKRTLRPALYRRLCVSMGDGKSANASSSSFMISLMTYSNSEQMRQKRPKTGPQSLSRGSNKSNGVFKTLSAVIEDEESDDGSVIDVSTDANGRAPRLACGVCKAKDSPCWWKAPRGFDLTSSVLCDPCGLLWRKYGEIRLNRAEDTFKSKHSNGEKRDATPLAQTPAKRFKVHQFSEVLLDILTVKSGSRDHTQRSSAHVHML